MFRRLRRRTLAALRQRGVQIARVPRALVENGTDHYLYLRIDDLVRRRLGERNPDFFVLQIGANDGLLNDPLHDCIIEYGWPGILVEPQARMFAALQTTYRGYPRLSLRQVAIAERDEVRRLYTLPDALPHAAHQLASFQRKHILRHAAPRDRHNMQLTYEDVQCLSFESLLVGVERVDLLHIDVEGYDAELIRLFDFPRWTPGIVQFEHVHLRRRDHDAAVRRLVACGYLVAITQMDTIGYLP